MFDKFVLLIKKSPFIRFSLLLTGLTVIVSLIFIVLPHIGRHLSFTDIRIPRFYGFFKSIDRWKLIIYLVILSSVISPLIIITQVKRKLKRSD